MATLIPIPHILNLLQEDAACSFVIPAVDGSKTLYGEKGDIAVNNSFHEWKLDAPSKAAPATHITMFTLESRASFRDVFLSISPHLETLALTQHQISEFLNANVTILRWAERSILFLFTEREQLWVALATFHRGGFVHVSPFPIDYPLTLQPDGRYVVVVPDLTLPH